MKSGMPIIDIETNAVDDWARLSDVQKIHCISARMPNGDLLRGRSDKAGSIEAVLKEVAQYDSLCGHNIIQFDGPVLEKLYGFPLSSKKLVDTIVMARCIYPDIKNTDYVKYPDMPDRLKGTHGLKAWGYRLMSLKDDFGETTDWAEVSDEMCDYCDIDTMITRKLFEHLMIMRPSRAMLELEHQFAKNMRQQEYNGFPFNYQKAEKLAEKLMQDQLVQREKLQEIFGPKKVELKGHMWKAPDDSEYATIGEAKQAGHGRKDLVEGSVKFKLIPFNPNSRDQIAERLMERGWKPTAYEGKRPAINEGVLKEIGTPEADALNHYLLISKRIGQLATGKENWMSHCRLGRIHGSVNTNGTVTGRCSHASPNVAQVPAPRAEYGRECRELFEAPKGKVLIGADASGLELRMLAHFLARYDGGAYGETILNGDIHTANQEAAGLPTRDMAKTFIYAFLYGAGDGKIGTIVGGGARQGKKLKQAFKTKIPAIGKLMRAIESTVVSRKELIGLDGRKLPIRSSHAALNVLLQSAGAVVMKKAEVLFEQNCSLPFEMHANVHDEVQMSARPEDAEEVGKCFVWAIKEAGKQLGIRIPLDGEYKIGANWAETH